MAKYGFQGRLAPGLVHYHFDSKLEILVAALRVMATEHAIALDAALATAATPAAELVAFIDVHLGLGANHDPERLACWIQVTGEALHHAVVRVELAAALGAVATGSRASSSAALSLASSRAAIGWLQPPRCSRRFRATS